MQKNSAVKIWGQKFGKNLGSDTVLKVNSFLKDFFDQKTRLIKARDLWPVRRCFIRVRMLSRNRHLWPQATKLESCTD